jgi:hypothetical protein
MEQIMDGSKQVIKVVMKRAETPGTGSQGPVTNG